MTIKREFGIIVQHDPHDPTYRDGGDSSRSTSLMALFGSKQDQCILLKHYIGNGLMCRNPNQYKWSDPSSFSRDQTVPYICALFYCKDDYVLREIFDATLKRLFLAQNYDLLTPAIIWIMVKGANIVWMYWLYPIVILWHYLEIIYNCKIVPKNEQNQLMAMCKIYGTEKLFKKLHPDWKKAVNDYWSQFPFRDQSEVADQMINNF